MVQKISVVLKRLLDPDHAVSRSLSKSTMTEPSPRFAGQILNGYNPSHEQDLSILYQTYFIASITGLLLSTHA